MDPAQAPESVPDRARRLLGVHDAPELLYGAIVAGSVLAVASTHAESGAPIVTAMVVVTAIYWLAHVYVEIIGGAYRATHPHIGSRIGAAIRDTVEILQGALPPIAVFLLARLLGADLQSAASIALWATVGLLVIAGAGTAYLAGVRGWALVVESLVAGGFGLLVILLKYLLH